MDNDGSTSAELEDPRTETAEPEPVDTEREEPATVDTETEPQTEATGDEPADDSAPDAKPEEPATGKPAAKPQAKAPERPDPVKAAIERLSSDGPTKPDPKAKPPAKPAEKPDAKAKDPAAQPEPTAQPVDPALAWMSPEQRRHTKGSVKEYIRKQHAQLAEAAKVVEAAKSDAQVGATWAQLIETQGLHWEAENLPNDAIAAALKGHGALLRAYSHVQQGYAPSEADLKVLAQQRQSLDAIDRLLGRSSTGEPSLHEGEIPTDLAALAELGLSERELRLIAADRARQTGKTKPAAPALAPAPAPRQQPPPNAQQRPAPAAPQQRQDATATLYLRLTMNDVARRMKIPADQVGPFYQRNIAPLVASVLAEADPQTRPEVAFKQLSPQAQRDLVNEAMTRFEASQRSTQPAPRRPQNAPLRTGGSPTKPPAPGDSVAAAIARLRSD